MMNFKKCVALCAMLFGVSSLATAEVIPVYQISEASGTFLQTTLTHDIYRYSADTKLNDLVVTDQQGNRLPYRIAAPSVQSSEQTNFTPVRFFPVAVGTAPETLLVLSSASIRLDDNQISVSAVKADKEELQNQSAPTDFYIADLSDLRTRADKLALLWPISEQHQYLEVDVSGTNDMSNWSPITKTTLVQLTKEGERLTRNKITLNLSEKQYAYIKLKFTRGNEQLQLTLIQVENTDTIANAPKPDVWEVSGELADEQKSALHAINGGAKVQTAAWEFVRDDIAPVNRLSLSLGTVMYGDNVKIFSRNTEKQPWNLVHQGIWFNTQVGDTWQQSDAINVYNNSDTQWRVELNELIRTTAKPQLVFTRQPQLLQFIANNAAPYNIAIDTQAAPDNQQTTTQIFVQLVNGKDIEWSQTNTTELKPNLNSFARHGMQISWKTILFWAIMIGAVGVLIWVAVRLMGQMRTS
ncbi:DUF3999 family protein [Cellvibrio sp. UBA7661]|uniref:DUF3999 family protein n=1 Tax=Cellvibrio sp. UBA7661 TaxID=1946311 RepID=UPI002F35BCCB